MYGGLGVREHVSILHDMLHGILFEILGSGRTDWIYEHFQPPFSQATN